MERPGSHCTGGSGCVCGIGIPIDNTVTDYNLLSASTNTTGFESLLLSNDLDDAAYYVLVYYAEGAREVTYTLTNRAAGNTVYEDTYNFAADEEGGAFFYGPLQKVVRLILLGGQVIQCCGR